VLHVNIGMESIDPATLRAMNKKQNKAKRYAEILEGLRRRGISYSLNFIFGWDGETAPVFPTTLDFLQRHKVPAAYFNILTPHKGTPFFDRMQTAGRILNEAELGRYPGKTCDILPVYCTPAEMVANVERLYRKFYSLPSIVRRLPPPLTLGNIASWMINLSQRRVARNPAHEDNFGSF
jgi:radical SAM superfamily enzyme YgiQ (UPF0313 family)